MTTTQREKPRPSGRGDFTDELLDSALAHAIDLVTDGQTDLPRPGQAALASDVAQAMRERGGVVGAAPTGVGKSIAYGIPAGLAAVRGERSVISTESLALQAQLIDKDLPVIAEAVDRATGMRPTFSILKGWSNYGCVLSAVAAAQEELGLSQAAPADPRTAVADLIAQLDDAPPSPTTGSRRPLIRWVLQQALDDASGDRHQFPEAMENEDWDAVSVSSAECVGVQSCPFGTMCRASRARENAAASDIVVTNHSMLAIQAAADIPVVVGNRKLGVFRHLVVDEAHALPGIIRNQGAIAVAGRRLFGPLGAIRRLLDEESPAVADLLLTGERLVDAIDLALDEFNRGRATPTKVCELGSDDDPLAEMGEVVESWITSAIGQCNAAKDLNMQVVVNKRRAIARLESLKADLGSVRKEQSGIARWLEVDTSRGRNLLAVKASPVEVGWMLESRVWSCDVPFDDDEPAIDPDEWLTATGMIDQGDLPDGEGSLSTTPRYPLTVCTVSATLPVGFPYQVGLRSLRTKHYESPFDAAYGASLLYVPRASSPEDRRALSASGGSSSRPRLDTGRHPLWAADRICDLVAANNGSALVLSATTAAGKTYVDELRMRAKGRWNVLSQWDGQPTRLLVDTWRDDEHSVLVGTRSLMTGVDAPGSTCSLVIVDRIPRAAFNPVDDARVKLIQERTEIGRWEADRLVYVADAALLLEQAAGRLIRSTSDSGMVAVLDPRLLKTGPFSMAHQSRKTYLDALGRFVNKTADADTATAFLNGLSKAS